MRIVNWYIYNTKTLKIYQNCGVDRMKAEETLKTLPNTECYAIGCKYFNL